MLLEDILRMGFSKGVSNLILGSYSRETSTRDTANKRFLELCAPIVLVLLEDGCGEWCFLPGQVVGNWYL